MLHDAASMRSLEPSLVEADKRRRSRSVEHDVRAKQARACDAERAWFLLPRTCPMFNVTVRTESELELQRSGFTALSLTALLVICCANWYRVQLCWRGINYLTTDGQLIVQGLAACSILSLTASLTYRMPRRGISSS